MRIVKFIIVITIFFTLTSCEKFLSERSNSAVSNIQSLADLQALLDAANLLNYGVYSMLLETATDDFYIGKGGFDRLDDFQKSVYLWNPEVLFKFNEEAFYWRNPFNVVAISNIILDELPHVNEKTSVSLNYIEGSALFFRAFSYHNLVQVYCEAYDPITASNSLGLPIRTNSDVNESPMRSSLEQTYQFIEQDILRALELLPNTSQYQTRPNRIAAHALLARLYLLMGRYSEAYQQTTHTLRLNDFLIDFSTLDSTIQSPIERFNQETIFYGYAGGGSILLPTRECYVDTNLYKMYAENDLRKPIFFQDEGNGRFSFRGSFSGAISGVMFNGLTVSEIMLIRAEASVRLGLIEDANLALSKLLESRYEKENFNYINFTSQEELLSRILDERRKELVQRGARWSDLKRLNRDPRFAKSIYRKIPGKEAIVELPPNDSRYIFPLPQSVIELRGLEQNPR